MVAQAFAERAEGVGIRQRQVDPAEAECRHPGSGSAGVPHVHRHVMVVAAGAHEGGLIAERGGLIEPEGADIERASGCDIAHRQMHMTHG